MLSLIESCIKDDLLKYSIHLLQKIQNTTARIVTRTSRFTQITPILKCLHWLPVLHSIKFKMCCLTHRAISLGKPYYLCSLLSNRMNVYSLRSSSFNPLVVPVSEKFIMAFALSRMLLFFFRIIFLMPFVLLPRTCLLEKNLKTCLINQAFQKLDSSLY